uniref:Uncharacterized protein n=1 Tax=Romanomermis culicivorax TaxID=13658 RepID=A0A915JNB4_ROMCU
MVNSIKGAKMFGDTLKFYALVMIMVTIAHARGVWFPHSLYFPSPAKNYPDYVVPEFDEVNFTRLETNPLEWPDEITTSKGRFRMKSLNRMSWEEDEIYIDHTYP